MIKLNLYFDQSDSGLDLFQFVRVTLLQMRDSARDTSWIEIPCQITISSRPLVGSLTRSAVMEFSKNRGGLAALGAGICLLAARDPDARKESAVITSATMPMQMHVIFTRQRRSMSAH